MSRIKEFRGRPRVRYQGDDTVGVLKIKVKLINQGDSSPFATLRSQMTVTEKGPIDIDFPFNLEEEGVPRFQGHVDVRVEATAEETWSDPTETLVGTNDKEGRILLPVIITHGLTGDLAHLGGYDTVGP